MTDSVPLIHQTNVVLPMLSGGRFIDKCDEHLRAAIEKLESIPERKGKATITITLDLALDDDRIDIKPTVKCVLPKDKGFSSSVFFVYEGALSVQHPRQLDMGFGVRAVLTPSPRGASA